MADMKIVKNKAEWNLILKEEFRSHFKTLSALFSAV